MREKLENNRSRQDRVKHNGRQQGKSFEHQKKENTTVLDETFPQEKHWAKDARKRARGWGKSRKERRRESGGERVLGGE